MSVPKGKQGKTNTDFFKQAYRLQDEITQLLVRDFGAKLSLRDLTTFTYSAKMTEDDRNTFKGICEKYKIDVEASYPYWLMEYYRETILKVLADLIGNITAAYTVYPATLAEFEMKRRYQWAAISNCYQLLQHMQSAIRNLPVNVSKYERFVVLIQEEIASLKAWKKSGNKLYDKVAKERVPV